MSAARSAPPRLDSDTHVMPLGAMLRLAAEGSPLVRCPACIHPCAKADEGDENCPECDGVHMVTAAAADEWLLRNATGPT